MTGRKQFSDPNTAFIETPLSNVQHVILENTYEPTQTWEEITSNSRNLPPCPGSIIEYHDYEKDRTTFAMVVKELQSKFNENHNKLIVLTLENELTRVYPQDINFTAYQVFDAEWISSLDILYHRFSEEYKPRLELVDMLNLFVHSAKDIQPIAHKGLRRVFATMASQNNTNSTSLLSLVKQMPPLDFQSYFHQCAYLMAIHLEMCLDVTRWMVLLCLPKQNTNLASLHCSNDIPRETVYFANSLNNFDTILDFMSYDETKLEEFNSYLLSLIEKPKDYDDLMLELNIWQGKPFLHAFRAMTFALVYPHSRLMSHFNKIPLFQHKNNVRLNDLERLLHKVGVLNNPKNALTDIVLSANVSGKPSQDQLAVASPKDLKPSKLELRSAQMASNGQLDDNFHHLRSTKSYYLDHVIYMLPSDKKFSTIGVSLEKVNARRYLINIHVPDVAARVPPASAFFEEVSKHTHSLRSLEGLLDNELIEVIAKNVRNELLLRALLTASNYFSVGDFDKKLRPQDLKTCMTVTFEYNTFALSPLKDLESGVSVSFDRISGIKVKELPWKTLDDVLCGRLDKSLLNPFKLFNRRRESEKKEEEVSLDENDLLNLGFISSVMKTHFSTRNFRCASTPQPALFQRSINRFLSYERKDEEELIKTDLDFPTVRDAMSTAEALFFTNEVKVFLESLVSSFCYREAIPALVRSDDLIVPSDDGPSYESPDPEMDEVFVSHDNKLLPNYYCSSYYQAILARDKRGFVSLPAFFIGNNYINKPNLTTTSRNPYLLTKGLQRGRVNVSDALSSVEAYLNQLQILSFLHLQKTGESRYLQLVTRKSHFKTLGYPVHGPLSDRVLNDQIAKLRDAELGSNYLAQRHDRYWKLKYLEQQLDSQDYDDDTLFLSCIITSLGHDMDLETKLARGWCVELAMEIDVMVNSYNDLTIGSTVTADKVMYLNPVEGNCIMRCKRDY